MCSVQISLLFVTFPSHIPCVLTLKQSTKEFKPHAHVHHDVIIDYVFFRTVMCYIDSLLTCIHINTANLLNIMCTLVATCMKSRRLECTCTTLKYNMNPYEVDYCPTISQVHMTNVKVIACVDYTYRNRYNHRLHEEIIMNEEPRIDI